MSISFKDLKNKKYLEPTKGFVESLLNIKFLGSKRARCPFQKQISKIEKKLNSSNLKTHCFFVASVVGEKAIFQIRGDTNITHSPLSLNCFGGQASFSNSSPTKTLL